MLGRRPPTAADAASLAWTTRVVKEAMRLYPPVYGMGRRTGAAGTAGSYRLKTPPGPVPLAAGITLRPAAALPRTLQRPA